MKHTLIVLAASLIAQVSIAKPMWSNNPVVLPNAKAKTVYFQSLVPFIIPDGSGNPLNCILHSAPGWVVLRADCTLGGTPAKTDIGSTILNAWVSDGADGDGTEVRIEVVP